MAECLEAVLGTTHRRSITRVVYTDDVAKDSSCIQRVWAKMRPGTKVLVILTYVIITYIRNQQSARMCGMHSKELLPQCHASIHAITLLLMYDLLIS